MIMKKLRQIRENQKKNGKKGFSMIELIIVIAIMAILIALIGTQLIPYLEKSRQSKDLTTLDTCLTNFQAAAAMTEFDLMTIKGNAPYDGIDKLPADIKKEYEVLAGAYNTDQKLNGAFKSNSAKDGNGNVKFGVDSNGVCYVEKGTLKASSEFAGTSATP